MTDWDSRERRKVTQMDIELDRLIRETHGDVRHLVKDFTEHKKDDKINFKELKDGQEWSRKIIYGALGIVAFIEFWAKVSK